MTAPAARSAVTMALRPVPAPVPLGVLELPLAAGRPAMIAAWISPPAEGGIRLSAPVRAHDAEGRAIEADGATDRLIGHVVATPPGLLSPAGLSALVATSGFEGVREPGWPDRLYLTASLVVFAYADASEALDAAGHGEGGAISPDSPAGRRLASAILRLGPDGAAPEATALAEDAARISAAIAAGTAGFAPRLTV